MHERVRGVRGCAVACAAVVDPLLEVRVRVRVRAIATLPTVAAVQ